MRIGETLKKAFIRKRTLILLLAVVGKVFLTVAKNSSYFAEEIFAKYIFKPMSQGISMITGIFPFSVAEMMVIICPALVVFLIVRFIRRLVKNREKRLLIVLTFFLNCACMASVVYFFYSFGCGINYCRYEIGYYLDLETRPSSKEELAALFAEVADRTADAREELTTFDENGVYVLPDGHRELGREAKEAWELFAGDKPVFDGIYPKPKPVMLSHLMSYTRIIGIYTCWTMEANVDVDISDYEIGYTMCHELAHLRGFIREDEANYLSYLVCTGSESPDLRYSGLIGAFVSTANALYAKDPDLYSKTLGEHYSEGVWKDLAANAEYWKQFEKAKKVAEVTDRMNDTYIKANDVEDGVESYGRVVDLLLAEYRKNHGLQ